MINIFIRRLNFFQNVDLLLVKSSCTIKFSTIALIGKGHWQHIIKSNFSNVAPVPKEENYIEFCGDWPIQEKELFLKDMHIRANFISEDEELKLFDEIEPYMQRLRYEYDHWDNAIHGYRETERKHWYPHNRQILDKIKQIAFTNEIIPYVHVLDLSIEGVIKPHVDSTRYCGDTIAGLSLLSDSVMRLVRTDAEKYQQNVINGSSLNEEYRTQPKETNNENAYYANILLPRNSLYIMSNSARYNFTHEILGNATAQFRGKPIKKGRRLSIICRNEP